MNMNKKYCLKSSKRLLAALTTGALLGLLTSAPATAAVFTTTDTVMGHAPTLSGDGDVSFGDINHNGVPDVGDVLTVGSSGLTFQDTDGDLSTGTTYTWYDGNDSLGTGDSYTIKTSDLGKTITVKALAHTDPKTTDPNVATSEALLKIRQPDGSLETGLTIVSSKDVISVSITGMAAGKPPMVGEELTAVPVCAGGSCKDDELEYVWSVGSATSGFSVINGQTSATYTPTKENQKKYIKVAVNTKNAVHRIVRK